MENSFRSLIENRVTTGHFDESRTIDDRVIAEIVRLATHAPSAFNLQNWRFISVRSGQAKERLCRLAFGQKQVKEAAATIIVCGRLDGYRDLRQTLQLSVDAGAIPSSLRDSWVEMVTEAIRNCNATRRSDPPLLPP